MKRSWLLIIVLISGLACVGAILVGGLYAWTMTRGFDTAGRIGTVASSVATVVTAVTTIVYSLATFALLVETTRASRQDRLDRVMPGVLLSLPSARCTVGSEANPTLVVETVELSAGPGGLVTVNGGRAQLALNELVARVACEIAIRLVGSGAAALRMWWGTSVEEFGQLSEGTPITRVLEGSIEAGSAVQGGGDSFIPLWIEARSLGAPVREVVEYRVVLDPWRVVAGKSTKGSALPGVRLIEVSRERDYGGLFRP